ncbi:uncharacterized protein K02A2.6-like [Ornithodoros turicata]|uniref:uncharacterized protein K02A2.6-like n=1 Tax=Ornithodoros turicata TaxID=34597 RepID=UPI00313918B0
MTSILPPPKPLDVTGDLWKAWKLWKGEFRLFSTATNLKAQPKEVQAATFLVILGEEGRKICNTLQFETEADRDDVDKLIQKLEEHCKPTLNLTYHEFLFGSRNQKEGERFDEWLTELRILAASCEFGTLEKRMLRSRIILGVRDKKLQQRLISENPSCEKVIETCRMRELSKQQFDDIQKEKDEVKEVHAVTKRTRTCSKCGYTHDKDACPAQGKECKSCGKLNHFASVCRSKGQRKKYRRKPKAKQVLEVEREEDTYFLQMLSVNNVASSDLWSAEVTIENVKLNCRVDTGANCSVISAGQLRKVTSKKTTKCNVTLNTFFGFKQKAAGRIPLQASCNGQSTKVLFFVVPQEVPLTLSGKASEELGLIQRTVHSAVATKTSDEHHLYGPAQPYRDVFEGLGKLRGVQYHMKLTPHAKGVVKPARRIAVALKDKVKRELDHMEADGVIAKVTEPTEWASNMVVVVKKDKVRICLDPADLNKALLREHYPMATLEDIAPRLGKAKYFSTLDASSGFWQIQLDKDSSYICTMSTPFGRYRFLRMPFGISTAPEVFQRAMHRVLQDLDGVDVVMDDILVWGGTKAEHDQRLMRLLERCRDVNLKLNIRKCCFLQQQVRYLGQMITSEGLAVDPRRVEDILAVTEPTNVKELRTFLGMINFVSRFIPNASQVSAPLRELLKTDTIWEWSTRHKDSFKELREALTKAPVLAYFQAHKPVTLSVDASQDGVGAVLTQEGHPVAYSSRSLTETQQRYAQIEKEMVAIVHGCEKFHEYIFGQPSVKVESDHKPLEAIFKKPLHGCPLRLQRMRLALQKYPINVVYKPGKEMFIADALSRFPKQECLREEEHFYVNVLQYLDVSDEKIAEISRATQRDSQLQKIRKYVETAWPNNKNEVDNEVRQYWTYKEEIHAQDGLLFRSNRLIIPKGMRQITLKLLHASHCGEEKMKERARDVMFWPGITSEIEQLARNCALCEKHRPRNERLPMISHELPKLPWQVIGADHFSQGGREFLILVDYYSFYYEVKPLKRSTAKEVVAICTDVFTTHGIPVRFLSDNGPPFGSHEFREGMRFLGVTHITSSPHYPRSNGMAERAVREAKKLLSKYAYESTEFKTALLEWRNTPRDKVLKSPVQRLMGRSTRTLLPVHSACLQPSLVQPKDVVSRLQHLRQRQQVYYNRGTRQLPQLLPDSPVTAYNSKVKTWAPATVVGSAGAPRSYIIRTSDGAELRRTREHLRSSQCQQQQPASTPENEPRSGPATESVPVRRSTRQRRSPRRYPLEE